MSRLTVMVFLMSTTLFVAAQRTGFPIILEDEDLRSYCTEVIQNSWFFFKAGSGIDDSLIQSRFAGQLGLTPHDQLVLQREQKEGAYWHRKYQHEHQGIPVFSSSLYTHGYGDETSLLHHHLAPWITVKIENLIALDSASSILLREFQEQRPTQLSPEWQISAQQEGEELQLTSRGKLYLTKVPSLNHYLPAYRFELRLLQPDEFLEVWIDARNGEVIWQQSLRRACQGELIQAKTKYYGHRNVPARLKGFPDREYQLETCGDQQVNTRYFEKNSFEETRPWLWLPKPKHSSSIWQDQHQNATTAHWCASQAWNYFESLHGWQGPDGEGSALRVMVDWDSENTNHGQQAFYEPRGRHHYLYIGERYGHSMAMLDVVGHEYAHAMIQAASQLGYTAESGALNEALADMFGVLVERHVLGDGSDWIIAREAGGIRNLAYPQDFEQPDRYEGTFWVPVDNEECHPQNDLCGIHTNSGVGGKWFYLLVEGGFHHGQEVFGIGDQDAAKIIFRATQLYLEPQSDFQDMRLASIQSALDLYGVCSNQVAQVRNAWAAVGIGRPSEQLCIQIEGPETFCLDDSQDMYLFNAQVVSGAQVSWTLPGPGFGYSITGDHDERLILTDIPDTLTQLKLVVHANYDSLAATQSVLIPAGICKNSQRQEIKLPDSEQWLAYPNPADEQLSLFFPEGSTPATLLVHDAVGKLISEFEVTRNYLKVDLAAWPAGYYLITLQNAFGRESKRISVAH
ncbi:MAG: M4 family metallopeptidase [Bacteroidota bacterium]